MANASATIPITKPRPTERLSLPQYLEERTPAMEPRKAPVVRATKLIAAVAMKDGAVEGPTPASITALIQAIRRGPTMGAVMPSANKIQAFTTSAGSDTNALEWLFATTCRC